MPKLVSIIIPAYNVEKYIQTTLRSIQKQTWKTWEAIVVDDGSTDQTAAKIKEFVSIDNRIRLIQQANTGSSGARNKGLAAAQGSYIAFLDGDDTWSPLLLEKLITAKELANTGFAYCGYTHVYDYGFKRGFRHPYPEGNILLPVVAAKTHIQIGCTLTDKDVIQKNGIHFTDGCLIGQDHEFLIKVLALTNAVAVPQELLAYRIRTGSAIHSTWRWQKHIHAVLGVRRSKAFVLKFIKENSQRQKIKAVFEHRIATQWLKLIWRMIKNGYYNDALALLDNPIYAQEISLLNSHKVSYLNSLKFKIVQKKDLNIWKKVSILGYF